MAANWREKYLAALDEQETQQKRFQHQTQQLRACIDQLARASDGLDPTLDDLLSPLKKKNSNARVNVDDLSKAAEQVISRRDTRLSVSKEALTGLVQCLKDLNPSSTNKANLGKFHNNIHKRIGKLHAYPQLLRELAELQEAVINDVVHRRPNWLAKLLGAPVVFQQSTVCDHVNKPLDTESPVEENTGEDKSDENEADENANQASVNHQLETAQVEKTREVESSIIEGEYELVSTDVGAQDVDKMLPGADKLVVNTHQESSQEPDVDKKFTKIEEKIVVILAEILDSVDVVDCVREKFEQSKERIHQGLNWYEMVVTLEDIRDLFSQALFSAQSEFENYLKVIDTALAEVKEIIPNQQNQNHHQQRLAADIKLGITHHAGALSESVAQASDLDSLKCSVANQVAELGHRLKDLDLLSETLVESDQETEKLKAKIQELEDTQTRLKHELEEQKYRALHDVLTGLPNRDFYNQWIYEKYRLWQDNQIQLVLCICDVDHFKQFNDTYGHQTGDRVLKLIGKLLGSIKKPENFVGRFGGEEFVIAFSGQGKQLCENLIDKIRAKLERTAFRFKDKPVSITASFGLTDFKLDDTIETALKRADDALYKAKADGRNRLCSA